MAEFGSMFLYMRALPPVGVLDKTGMNEAEKRTMQQLWRLMKCDLKKHSRNISSIFYWRYPMYSLGFTRTEAIFQHTRTVLNCYETLINEGLYNPPLIDCSFFKMMQQHTTVKLTRTDIEQFNNIFRDYVWIALRNHRTLQMKKALKAFTNKIESKFTEVLEEQQRLAAEEAMKKLKEMKE